MSETKVETEDQCACRVVQMPDGIFIEGYSFDRDKKFCVRRDIITQLVTNAHNTCVIVCEPLPGPGDMRPMPADRIATCHPYDIVRAAMAQTCDITG